MREICVMFFMSSLGHPNIVPFLGLETTIWPLDGPSIVIPWMENGTIMDYLRSRVDQSSLDDVRYMVRPPVDHIYGPYG